MTLFLALLTASQLTCVADNEPTYLFDNGKGRCADSPQLDLPIATAAMDLSNFTDDSPGSCKNFRSVLEIPAHKRSLVPFDVKKIKEAGGFPLLIKLPIVKSQSLDCKQVCHLGESEPAYQPTSLGIAFKYIRYPEYSGTHLPDGYTLTFRAEKPWFFVSGNENDSTPCMDGRPTILEYGEPLSCHTVGFGDGFGLATAKITDKFGYAIIDLVKVSDLKNVGGCCPYRCK